MQILNPSRKTSAALGCVQFLLYLTLLSRGILVTAVFPQRLAISCFHSQCRTPFKYFLLHLSAVLLTLLVQGLSAVETVALDDIKGGRKEANTEIAICISSPISLSTLISLRRQEATLFSTVVFKYGQENSN